jgi:uncharacterized RDD family membrane protein YckC
VNGRPPGDGPPAGFWIRAAAAVVDLAVLSLVQLSLGLAARGTWGAVADDSAALSGMIGLFTAVFGVLYTAVLHASGGQTVGKMVVGVRVVAEDGEPLALGAALLRHLAYAASLLPLGLGFVMAGLRRDKRALHDLLAGSRVERVAARRARPALTVERAAPPA